MDRQEKIEWIILASCLTIGLALGASTSFYTNWFVAVSLGSAVVAVPFGIMCVIDGNSVPVVAVAIMTGLSVGFAPSVTKAMYAVLFWLGFAPLLLAVIFVGFVALGLLCNAIYPPPRRKF